AGHYAVVVDGRETYWHVDAAGRLRDYPPGRRWCPLPPPAPAGIADRDAWREDWYASHSLPLTDRVAVEAAAGARAAGARLPCALAAGRIPAPLPPRPRRPVYRPRRLSPAEQARRQAAARRREHAKRMREAEAMAAARLAGAGMSVRAVARV